MRHLTRGLAEAVPHDPTFVAMTEGNGVIQTTWGDLASRLVEAGVVEADSVAICDFLCITHEQLRDPGLVFAQYGDDTTFRNQVEQRVEEDHVAQFAAIAKSDNDKLVANSEQWNVEHSESKVAELQAEIEADREVLLEYKGDDYWLARARVVLKDLHRSAVESGVCVNLTDFVSEVLSAQDLQYFTYANVIHAIECVVDMIFSRNNLDRNVAAAEVFLGRRQIIDFNNALVGVFRRRIHDEQLKRWDAIAGHIYAGSIYDHPLLAGAER